MRKRFNKLVAAFLVVVLSVAFVPLAAIAIDGADQEDPITEPAAVQADNNGTEVSGTTDTPATTGTETNTPENTTEGTNTEGKGGTLEGGYNDKEVGQSGDVFGGGNGNDDDGDDNNGDDGDEGTTNPVDAETILIELNFAHLEDPATEIPQNATINYAITYPDAQENSSVAGGLTLDKATKVTDTTYQWSLDRSALPADLTTSDKPVWSATPSNLEVEGYIVGIGTAERSATLDAKKVEGEKAITLTGKLLASTGKISLCASYLIPYSAVHYYYDRVTETENGNILAPNDYLNEAYIKGTLNAPNENKNLTFAPVVSGSTVKGTITEPLDFVPFWISGTFKIQQVPESFVVTKDTSTASKGKEFYFYYVRTLKVIWIDTFGGQEKVIDSIDDWIKGEEIKIHPTLDSREGYRYDWLRIEEADGNITYKAIWETTDDPNPAPPNNPDGSTSNINSPSAGSGSGAGITRPTQVVYLGGNGAAPVAEEVVADEATPMAAPVENATPQQIADDETPKAAPVYTVPSIEYTIMLLGFLLIAAFGVAAVVRRIRDEHTKSAFERHLLG